jgi:hypothetical protein
VKGETYQAAQKVWYQKIEPYQTCIQFERMSFLVGKLTEKWQPTATD